MAGQGTPELGAWYLVSDQVKVYLGDDIRPVEAEYRKIGAKLLVDASKFRVWNAHFGLIILIRDNLRVR